MHYFSLGFSSWIQLKSQFHRYPIIFFKNFKNLYEIDAKIIITFLFSTFLFFKTGPKAILIDKASLPHSCINNVGKHSNTMFHIHKTTMLSTIKNVQAKPVEETNPQLCITTLFCTANLSCTIDLENVCKKAWNIEFCSRRSLATIRIRNPMATAQIYPSGKMIVSGTRTESEGKIATRKFAKMIQKANPNYTVGLRNFRVRSFAGDCHFKFKSTIDLNDLCRHIGTAIYEPELTPNHITYYPMKNRKMAVSIYSTGYVKISGGQSREEMERVFSLVYDVLLSYKRLLIKQLLIKRMASMKQNNKCSNPMSPSLTQALNLNMSTT